VGWAALAVAAFAVLRGAGFLSPEMIWLDAVGIAVKLGVMGGIVGGCLLPRHRHPCTGGGASPR
jgi:hypothetical protein